MSNLTKIVRYIAWRVFLSAASNVAKISKRLPLNKFVGTRIMERRLMSES